MNEEGKLENKVILSTLSLDEARRNGLLKGDVELLGIVVAEASSTYVITDALIRNAKNLEATHVFGVKYIPCYDKGLTFGYGDAYRQIDKSAQGSYIKYTE